MLILEKKELKVEILLSKVYNIETTKEIN